MEAIPKRIAEAFERRRKAVELRPGLSQGTAVTRVTMRDGAVCDIEDGPWKLIVDLPEKHGGSSAGPNPGVLGRGALGSCLAVGYAMWAAHLGVPLNHLEIEVQADYDSRGELGLSDSPAGYREVRYIVRVESDAPEAEVQKMLDTAEAHSPYLDVFARAQPMRRTVEILSRRS